MMDDALLVDFLEIGHSVMATRSFYKQLNRKINYHH